MTVSAIVPAPPGGYGCKCCHNDSERREGEIELIGAASLPVCHARMQQRAVHSEHHLKGYETLVLDSWYSKGLTAGAAFGGYTHTPPPRPASGPWSQSGHTDGTVFIRATRSGPWMSRTSEAGTARKVGMHVSQQAQPSAQCLDVGIDVVTWRLLRLLTTP
jgi:hypothetical protein